MAKAPRTRTSLQPTRPVKDVIRRTSTPREHGSGTSVRKRTRLSKAGNARLRQALYLPALTAIRFNPLLKALYERLVAAGKARMAAVGACMRKLLMIAYRVLKNRTPFDPSWASKTVP
jgi:transposase